MTTLFISMIGPEERVMGFFKKPDKPQIDKYLFFINKEYESNPRVLEYRSKIYKILKGKAIDVINTSYFDSLELVRVFNQYVSKNNIDIENFDICLDISTFNRQNLLTILFLLRMKFKQKIFKCYYTIPKDTNINISKCAHTAANVPFFGGKQSIDKNKLLLLLVGYEYDRPMYLWEKIEPSKTIIAVGDKPTDKKFLVNNRKVVSSIKKRINAEEVSVSARDPYKAKQDIEKIIKENMEDYNIIISPMNTKLQTLGLYLAWENFPEVQIVYSCPESFGDWLSKGIRDNTEMFLIK